MSDERNVSRREVLRGTLAAAFAMGMPPAVARAVHAAQDPKAAAADAAAAAKKAEPVTIAWIGTGTQGRNDMSKLVRMAGVKIGAICDIYDPYYEQGLKMAGPDCQGYKDYRKLLERKDIQGVGIATPLYLHAQMAIDALNAGKHVYVEKMMAYTLDEAKKMVRAADRTGKILQVGHQRRYSVDYHHALDLVRRGYFGEITHVRAQWNRRNNWRRPVPDKKFERLLNWRLYKDYSRGLMAELGSHQIDVANWFLGAQIAAAAQADQKSKAPASNRTDLHPISVVGLGGVDYWKDGREVFDNVQVVFEYPNGAKLAYQSIETNEFDGFSEQFMGRKGTLITSEAPGASMMFKERGSEDFDFAKFSQNKTQVGKREAIILDAGATTRQDKREKTAGQSLAGAGGTASKDNWYLSLEDWVDCIRTGRKPFCDGRVGMADVACVLAANKAMEEGIKVRLTKDMFEV